MDFRDGLLFVLYSFTHSHQFFNQSLIKPRHTRDDQNPSTTS